MVIGYQKNQLFQIADLFLVGLNSDIFIKWLNCGVPFSS
ncbi:hypothetical protein CRENPOLYSF1_90036 [Crenothrix polyspora]|uniref:Uncharacterized protein n=1 Tax=Crenothrix polyspora TaxID=360316 RepID=A0A1R4HJM8_9GAMM|nr:hypothetical protein CRENPOLYSF1_90036 [Crenothrix polyspora]